MSQRRKRRRPGPAVAESAVAEQGEGAITSERQVPVWVYIVLLIFVVAVLLGVELILDWLLPARGR